MQHNSNHCSNTFLFTDEIACADPVKCKEFCENEAGCTNLAYPLLVLRVLPAGKQNEASCLNLAYPLLVLIVLPAGKQI